MPYFPREFDAPERRAELRKWLATLRGPAKPKPVPAPERKGDPA